MSATQAIQNPSYADIARTPPTGQHSTTMMPSVMRANFATLANTVYCTIDISRVEEATSDQISAGAIRAMVESEMRAEQDGSSWRCRAVTKDPRNPHRIRIACRDETEHAKVKQMVETKLARGARILTRRPLPHPGGQRQPYGHTR